MISLKICLIISLVSSLQIFDVFSSYSISIRRFARFELADCRLYFFRRDFRYSFFIILFLLGVVFSTVFVKSLVKLSKGIGDSFARSDAFAFCVLDFRDGGSLLC